MAKKKHTIDDAIAEVRALREFEEEQQAKKNAKPTAIEILKKIVAIDAHGKIFDEYANDGDGIIDMWCSKELSEALQQARACTE